MHRSKFGYGYIISIGNALQPILLLAIRLFWGWQFTSGGWGKFDHIEGIIDYFTSLNIPFPEFNAYFVSGVELVGGLMLMAGFASRLAALFLSSTMIVAMFTAHSETLKLLFTNPLDVVNLTPFSFLFACIIVFVFGPGAISIDALIKRFYYPDSRHQ